MPLEELFPARQGWHTGGMEQQRYPVGRFAPPGPLSSADRTRLIDGIAAFPRQLSAQVSGLTEEQLQRPYRAGGWTVRQVVHHVVDSHINAYVRSKWTLTEDAPTVKPYDQDAWSGLADVQLTPVDVSLRLLAAVTERWVTLLRALSEEDFSRPFEHPEEGSMTLDTLVALYEWHGRHHLGHVLQAIGD